MKPEVIEREVIHTDHDVAQMIASLEQRVFLGRDDAERERRLSDVAHVRIGIAGELAVLFRRPNLGLDRFGVDRRLQREFDGTDRFGLDQRHVSLGGQAVTRGRRRDQQLGDLMPDLVRRHVIRMAERENGAEQETADELVRRYQSQLTYYARALSQITGKAVKEKIIYSFALGKEINV